MLEEKCIRLEGVIEKSKHQHHREMALREQELQSHHRNELDSIDEKVRKTLSQKDEKIKLLMQQLRESEKRREDTEELIKGMQVELGL
jgi:hypothetical protein